MASLFKRSNGKYYTCYEEDGKRKWKSTGQIHKSDALRELIHFETHLKTYRSKITLKQFTEDLFVHAQTSYAPKTVEMYSAALNRLQSILGDKHLSSISPRDADLYRATRSKEVSPVSVNIELRTLRASFSLAQRWKLISENPFKRISLLRIPEQRPVYIRKEDFGKLLSAIEDPWFRELVTFAVLTGLRRGEILNLTWKDVDLERKLIHIQSGEGFITKAGKRRSVPMNERVRNFLSEKPHASLEETVFTFGGNRIRGDHVTKKLKASVRKAGLDEKIHFHSLRHTFATWLVQGSVNIFEVQKLLGHSNVSTTQVYSHLASSELQGAVDRLELNSDLIQIGAKMAR